MGDARPPPPVRSAPGWRVILDGEGPPAFNMALDQAIAERVALGECPPTVRFYGWDRPCVSLGYHQMPDRVLDVQAVYAHGIVVVKRPTGGRAVLHGDDLTYSIALPSGGPWSIGITEAYRMLSEGLQRGFRRAGLDVALARGHREGLGPGPLPCFASTARYELVWKGRKLVGSAQRRLRGGLLQQGSIPLTRGPIRLEELVPAGQKVRVEDRWTTVQEAAGLPVDRRQLARELAIGLGEQFGVALRFAAPDTAELTAAQRMISEE